MKKSVLVLLLCLGFGFLAKTPALAATALEDAQVLYQNQLKEYSSAAASFERERQIYSRDNSENNFVNVINSAQVVLAARAQTMSNYCLYLLELCKTYITNQIELADLTENLQNQNQQFLSLNHEFTQTTTWYQEDAKFAQIMANLSNTAYEAYAWIYWSRLSQLVDLYQQLVDTQQERIIAEAETQILAEQKRKTIQESERTLANLKADLAVQEKKLTTIRNYETYTQFAHALNIIQSDLQTSLKVYAELE
ncbi:MAG: hypothetical protein Q4G02_02370 [bacterium]|nr:hypothetical protein [bacterium]